MFHLSALAFIMSVFLTNMTDRDPVFYHGFIHCIFSSFCLQMTNNFLSIASTIPVKIIPWEMFLIWDKNTANVCKTVSVFLRRVWAPVSVGNVYAKYCRRRYASREHTKCRRIGISMCIRTLRNLSICFTQITLTRIRLPAKLPSRPT